MPNGWRGEVTADPQNGYSGIGIFIAPWLSKTASISACTRHPGRLLHVKCETERLTMDIVGLYQHVEHAPA